MKFKAIDGNYAQSECGRYTISRAPATAFSVSGCYMAYTLWFGKEQVAVERCKNYVEERTEAMVLLRDAAVEHAAGLKS